MIMGTGLIVVERRRSEGHLEGVCSNENEATEFASRLKTERRATNVRTVKRGASFYVTYRV